MKNHFTFRYSLQFFFVFFVGILLSHSATSQQRRVLYEEFTSETCYPCYGTDTNLYHGLNTPGNDTNVQLITYSCPYPSGGVLFQSNVGDFTARMNFYNVQFVPYGRLDGLVPPDAAPTNLHGHPNYLTQAHVDSAVAKPANFNVIPHCSYNATGDSFFLKVQIQCIHDFAPANAKLKLYTAFVRTLDYLGTAPGSQYGNMMKHFENVVRKLYPNPDGIILNNSWLAGDTNTIEFSGLVQQEQPDSIQVPHSFTEGCFITWIQNDNDFVVEQTSKTKVQTPLSTLSIPVLNASIYPIPAKEILHISGENLNSYKLINLSGEVLKQEIFQTNNSSISLSEIPTGSYILELIDANYYHRFEKIIVEK